MSGRRPRFHSGTGGGLVCGAADRLGVMCASLAWFTTTRPALACQYPLGNQKLFNGEPDNNLTTWQLGFAFPYLFAPGNTLAIAAGQPVRATNKANGMETDYELYCSFRLNDRITLTPDLQIISQPGNVAGNSTLILSTLRMLFTF